MAFWAKIESARRSCRRHAWIQTAPGKVETVCPMGALGDDIQPVHERYRFPKKWGAVCHRCEKAVIDDAPPQNATPSVVTPSTAPGSMEPAPVGSA